MFFFALSDDDNNEINCIVTHRDSTRKRKKIETASKIGFCGFLSTVDVVVVFGFREENEVE